MPMMSEPNPFKCFHNNDRQEHPSNLKSFALRHADEEPTTLKSTTPGIKALVFLETAEKTSLVQKIGFFPHSLETLEQNSNVPVRIAKRFMHFNSFCSIKILSDYGGN